MLMKSRVTFLSKFIFTMIFAAPGMKGREKINRKTRTKNNDDEQTKKKKVIDGVENVILASGIAHTCLTKVRGLTLKEFCFLALMILRKLDVLRFLSM